MNGKDCKKENKVLEWTVSVVQGQVKNTRSHIKTRRHGKAASRRCFRHLTEQNKTKTAIRNFGDFAQKQAFKVKLLRQRP